VRIDLQALDTKIVDFGVRDGAIGPGNREFDGKTRNIDVAVNRDTFTWHFDVHCTSCLGIFLVFLGMSWYAGQDR